MNNKKIKKVLTIFVAFSTILVGTTAFASASHPYTSGRWSTQYCTFAGYLNTYSGKRAAASTQIEAKSSNYANNNAYVYLEGQDSNGYRTPTSPLHDYGSTTAYVGGFHDYYASYFESRHTTDYDAYASNGNHYFQLSAF